jgi:hypothetical protein
MQLAMLMEKEPNQQHKALFNSYNIFFLIQQCILKHYDFIGKLAKNKIDFFLPNVQQQRKIKN